MTLRDRLDAAMAQLRPSQPVEKPVTQPDPPGAIPASLVNSAKAASWIAFFALVYFLWLYTLGIAADRAESLHLTKFGQWVGDIQFWFPHIFGFAAVAVGIPYVAKIAIPVFMSLDWKANAWPKAWALFIALAVSLVVIAGTFTVQGHNIVEKGREALVAEQTQQQGVAALQARRDAIKQRWETLTASSNTTLQAQAARAGVAGWDAYIAAAKQQVAAGTTSPARLALIERAKGSAIAAEEYQKQMDDLTAQIAAAPTAASAAARVETGGAGWIQSTLDWLEGTRAILLSLVMDIVCLMMPWIALRLEQARNRQLAAFRGEDFIAKDGRPAWATEAQMIPDFREEETPRAKPMVPNNEKVFDAETGEELVKIKPREYYRRAGKKKKGEAVEMPADPIVLADESGLVFDSDSRAARSGVEEGDDLQHPGSEGSVQQGDVASDQSAPTLPDDGAGGTDASDDQPEPQSTTDDLYAALGLTDTQVDDDFIGPRAPEKTLPNGEGVMLQAAE